MKRTGLAGRPKGPASVRPLERKGQTPTVASGGSCAGVVKLGVNRGDNEMCSGGQQDGEGSRGHLRSVTTDVRDVNLRNAKNPLPVLFALWLLLNVVDAALTLYAQHLVAPYGGSVETSFWLTRLPLGYSMAVKLFGALLVGALLVKWRKVGMTATACAAMAGVCVWNAKALIGG